MPLARSRRVLRASFLAATIALLLPSGCNGPADRSAPDLGPAIDRARAATADLADRAIRLEKNLVALRGTSGEIRDALRTSATEGRALLHPPAPALLVGLCDHIDAQAARIEEAVLPRIDESLKDAEAIRAGAAILSGPVLDELLAAEGQVAALAKERDALEKDRDNWKERATSAIRKWLTAVGIGAFVALLASGAIFVYVNRKAGVVCGVIALATFATAAALSRWYEYFEWAGLGILVLGFGLLGYLAWRYRKSFVQVVQGGEDVKKWLELIVSKLTPEELIEKLASMPKGVRTWFNAIQKGVQDKATQAMVVKTKKENGGGDSSETGDPPPAG